MVAPVPAARFHPKYFLKNHLAETQQTGWGDWTALTLCGPSAQDLRFDARKLPVAVDRL